MWLDELDELFKGYFPYYVLVFLPIFLLVSNPVSASHEFPVYRMQHFDLHGIPYGSRSAAINFEARSVSSWANLRHCVVTRLADLTLEHFRNIRAKAGALIIELPQSFKNFTQEQKQQLLILENRMLYEQETPIPVYFSKYNSVIDDIITELSANVNSENKRNSATGALFSSVSANGYQIVVSTSPNPPQTNGQIATIHGHLAGYRPDGKSPTIAIVAHYDSFGLAPDLSFGADSNASGVVIMLELIRLLSGLYSDPNTRGKFNIVFILAGGGKANYQGSKKLLEDQIDSTDSSLIQEAAFVVCLDTLAISDTIHMHVSKPPKEGSAAAVFYKILKSMGEKYPSVSIEGVHKKINLADDLLAWEHERYSIRRLPAFTLSGIKSHKDAWRSTILDTPENVKIDRLVRNTKIIADTIGQYIYKLSDGEVFGGSGDVNEEFIKAWMDYLTSQPRSPQFLDAKDHPLIIAFQDTFSKYLRDMKVSYAVPDTRDPDYQFYGTTTATLNIYSVKPAIFDLILTLAIASYLVSVYFAVTYVPLLYSLCSKIMKNQKVKAR